MSYEGHIQHWCKNGHYWEVGYGYGNLSEEEIKADHTCLECSESSIFENSVDDTNCDAYGEIPPQIMFNDKNGHAVYVIPKNYTVGHLIDTKEPIAYYFYKDGIHFSHRIHQCVVIHEKIHYLPEKCKEILYPKQFNLIKFGFLIDFDNDRLVNPYQSPTEEI